MARRLQVQSGKRTAWKALGVAAGATLTSAGTVQASIIYNNVNQTLINPGTINTDLNRDTVLDGALVLTETVCNPSCGGNNLARNLGWNPLNNSALLASNNQVNPLNFNDLIGPGGNFLSNNFNLANRVGDVASGPLAQGGKAYLGLLFDIPGGSPHFAWLRVAVDPATFSLTFLDYGFETQANAGIRAGEVPEPASLGLLAVGALGILAMRKRRSKS